LTRRIIPLAGVLAALLLAPSAMAAGASSCKLDADVQFSRGLGLTGDTYSYALSGALSSCTGSMPESSGTISDGATVTVNGVQYRAPDRPVATGSCAGLALRGVALIQWNDGKLSELPYFASSAGYGPFSSFAGQFTTGTVTLTRVVPDPKNPSHTTDTFPLAYGNDWAAMLMNLTQDASQCVNGTASSGTLSGSFTHASLS
jgi:hypothetical protein